MISFYGKKVRIPYVLFIVCLPLIETKDIRWQTESLALAPQENVVRSARSQERINLSVPGTKWCGPGNTASSYNDLGEYADVDACCRDHDHCDNIPAGETKYNLTNNDHFTVLHCTCDKEFYKCLEDINSERSNGIGKLYFTLRKRCYREDYPIVSCAEYDTAVFIRRCVRYVLDEAGIRRYQYFDLPLYRNSRYMDDLSYIQD